MTLLSSYGLLACMFVPKMYVILRLPEQNTHEAVSSQVSEFFLAVTLIEEVTLRRHIPVDKTHGCLHQEFASVE